MNKLTEISAYMYLPFNNFLRNELRFFLAGIEQDDF